MYLKFWFVVFFTYDKMIMKNNWYIKWSCYCYQYREIIMIQNLPYCLLPLNLSKIFLSTEEAVTEDKCIYNERKPTKIRFRPSVDFELCRGSFIMINFFFLEFFLNTTFHLIKLCFQGKAEHISAWMLEANKRGKSVKYSQTVTKTSFLFLLACNFGRDSHQKKYITEFQIKSNLQYVSLMEYQLSKAWHFRTGLLMPSLKYDLLFSFLANVESFPNIHFWVLCPILFKIFQMTSSIFHGRLLLSLLYPTTQNLFPNTHPFTLSIVSNDFSAQRLSYILMHFYQLQLERLCYEQLLAPEDSNPYLYPT